MVGAMNLMGTPFHVLVLSLHINHVLYVCKYIGTNPMVQLGVWYMYSRMCATGTDQQYHVFRSE